MIRKTLFLTAALFALIVASAQAHTINIGATCGSVTIQWENFNDGSYHNSLNGGLNQPTYTVSWTPVGQTTPIVTTGQVTFDNSNTERGVPQYMITVALIPALNGTVVVNSSWTSRQTSDGFAASVTETAQIGNCSYTPSITTTATPTTASVGSSVTDVATLTGGYQPTGSITWRLYGPNDPSCSNPNAPSVTDPDVNGDGSYTSPPLTPSQAGTYHWVASYGGDINNNPVSGHCSDAGETLTVTPVTPTLTTSASPASAPIGSSIQDVATLSGGYNPTGTITWSLYGPNDNSCSSSTPLTTSAVTVTGDASYTSPPLTPTTAGTYHWVASYSGDTNNSPVGPVGCTDPHEAVTISPVAPALATSASPASAPVGSSIEDVATLTGGDNPTGTITWSLYGPNDNSCSSSTPLTTSAVTVTGDASYTSPPLTPTTAGTYHWVASYSGDTNNSPVGPVGCTDPHEAVTISPVAPTLATSASPASTPVGSSIQDVATLTGGDNPTGTISWTLYGPNDTSGCTTGGVSTAKVTVTGDGSYTSPPLTPSTAGTYHWVATYSGDVNNVSVGPVGCTDTHETVIIGQVGPKLTTSASPASAPVGTPIKDVATLSGGDNPTGTITWTLYGPNDTSGCTTGGLSTSKVVVNGDGNYTSPPLTPITAGSYHWVASYSGDVNNVAVGPVGCTDPGEAVTITPLTPALTTSATPASAAVNTAITDVATLSGGDNPTGSITWSLYGPNDNSCSSSSPQTTSTVKVNGDGTYTSPPLTPSTAGTYHWVATYTGDVNNSPVGPVGCADASETVTIAQVAPTLTTAASSGSVTAGASVTDVATLSGGDNPTGTITWSLYGPNDDSCASPTPQTTSAVTVNGDGNYTSPALPVSTAGTYHWVASYSGDTNNAAVGPVGCTDPSETVTAVPAPAPAFTLQKLQSLSSSGFTASPITAQVGQTINYQVVVTNTGNTPLSLALVDTMCTNIAGPTGNISGGYLQVGGTATYTCSHVVVSSDAPTYVNVAQVTATPPSGTALPPQRSSVLANVPRAAVLACTTSKTSLKETSKTIKTASKSSNGKTTTTTTQLITAILSDPNHGTDITKVVFSLDGRAIKTLTKPNLSGGRFEVQVSTASTRYGAHRITAAVTMTCGPAQTNNVSFNHALPAIRIIPRFTG